MREFFKGWRRKTGCVTLVMAFLFSGIQIRSIVVCDKIVVTLRGWKTFVYSERGRVCWYTWDEHSRHRIDSENLKVLGIESTGRSSKDSKALLSSFPEWRSERLSQPIPPPPGKWAPDLDERFAFVTGDPLAGFPSTDMLNADVFTLNGVAYSMRSASYWMLVLPLTLLSAYLILCKPRKRPA